ncbi:Uncharacterised protein [Bordetella pertussis]|nr:Uncharacterised protein [Bordetella pertussis]CPM31214.1 Uncharacterised protein [Bordetella pertussis]CPO16776.1 Uncharacterised protein [Bordetella pertussis]
MYSFSGHIGYAVPNSMRSARNELAAWMKSAWPGRLYRYMSGDRYRLGRRNATWMISCTQGQLPCELTTVRSGKSPSTRSMCSGLV